MRESERGQSLLEVVVCVAVLAVLLGTVLAATLGAAHTFVPIPEKAALDRAVSGELAVAVDLLKYDGASIPPTSVATAVPMPTGSPLPVELRVETQTLPSGGVSVRISGTTPDRRVTSEAQATIAVRAPYPGSSLPGISAAAPVAAPTP